MKRTLAGVLTVVALAGCGSDDDASTAAATTEAAPTADATTGISVDRAWARTSATGQTTGAIYFELTASADDRLVGASVPATVAADAQVHEVVPADMAADEEMGDMDDMGTEEDMDHMDDMATGDTMDDMGAMVMRELTSGLPLTAETTVAFAPGGYHIMLLDLVEPLAVGDEIELTLDFETAGSQTITVIVAESAP